MNRKVYMAIDQYGETFHGLVHPRKELCEKIGVKHVDKMYCDPNAKFCGYVIGGHWLFLHEVKPI